MPPIVGIGLSRLNEREKTDKTIRTSSSSSSADGVVLVSETRKTETETEKTVVECSVAIKNEEAQDEGIKTSSGSSSADQGQRKRKNSKVPCSHGGSVYRILVVDDSPMSRKMLLKILRKDGHICEEAEDGLMAVDKVKEKLLLAASSMSDNDNDSENKSLMMMYDCILMDFGK